jgi:hypothetical protein
MLYLRCEKGLFAIAAVLIAGIVASSSAWALSLPGISDSGTPSFVNPVKVSLNPNSGTLKVTGKKDFGFDDGTMIWQGNSAKYSLLADFDSAGGFLDGTVSLYGGIDGLNIQKNSLLMSADLMGWNLTDNPTLWGFNTANIVCNPLLLVQCTPEESVYIALDTPFDFKFNGAYKSNGVATTTIPVPASLWLFGSGLALLYGLRRRLTSVESKDQR